VPTNNVRPGGDAICALGSFQDRVRTWLDACFGGTIPSDREERCHRFLEEAIELAQASGCSRDHAHLLVEYVYSRPSGTPAREVGGVMVTLAGLCQASDVDMAHAGNEELLRNWKRLDEIRAKRSLKRQGSPLP
jgi:hypothetical protein